jgi:alpha-galactosidase
MILNRDKMFLLSTQHTSYVLYVNEVNKVVSAYYGKRIDDLSSCDCFVPHTKIPKGTSVAYDNKINPCLTIDAIRSEYSSPLKGDYHTPSLLASSSDSCLFDFSYVSFKITEPGKIKDYPTPHGVKEELQLCLEDKKMNVRLILHYLPYEEEDTFGRYVEVINQGTDEISLTRVMSYQLVIPNDNYHLLSLYGTWAGEGKEEDALIAHGRMVLDSSTGSSSNRHNPFFAILKEGFSEEQGEGYAFNLVYSGNHEESLELDTYGYLRIQGGLSPFLFRKNLKKDEEFISPLGVMTYSFQGLNGLRKNCHAFVNDCVIPPRWKNVSRPIVYNNWEATMFRFKKSDIIALMKKAKKIGAECFVLDDGWFSTRNSDSSGLGDWTVNKKKLPGGLKALSDEADKLKLKFGIWMEPEMVNPDSECYRKHPDWVIKEENHTPSLGRNQLTLDLRKKEVQDFIFEAVSSVLQSAHISFLKWDYNRNMTDIPGGEGTFFNDYIIGLYKVADRITSAFPDILIENCASGGNRHDLGMLSYFPQTWVSDDTDSFERLGIQSHMSLGYPLSVLSNHVSAPTSNQLLRMTSLDSKFDVACFGVLGYELNINDLSKVEEKTLKAQTEFYKKHRQLFQWGEFKEVVRLESKSNYISWQVKDQDEGVIGRFEKLQQSNPGEQHLKGRGFDEKKIYAYEARKETISIKKLGNLINYVLKFHVVEDGFLINFASRRYALESETYQGKVQGSGLNSQGPLLPEEWEGTGFDMKTTAIIGDFGGRLYYISPLKN